jgi:spore coat polysaccharide biosynthesis predicted glycosyltransferase SpsG
MINNIITNVILRVDVDDGKFAGTGHLSRINKIIFFLKKNYNIKKFIFLSKKLSKTKFTLSKYKNFKLIFYNNNFEKKLNFIKKDDIVICDTPFGIDKKLKLFCIKKKISKVVLIDDLNKPNVSSCLILNGIISFKKKITKRLEYKIFQGPKYVLLDKKYKKIKKCIKKNILVCVGGTDKKKILVKILKNINKVEKRKIFVILGMLINKNNPVYRLKKKNIIFVHNSPNLKKYFNISSACILTGGITMFESISQKKNTLVIENYKHQKYAIDYFNKNCFIKKIGVSSKINYSKMNRLLNSNKNIVMQRIIDGHGLSRIESEIKKYISK